MTWRIGDQFYIVGPRGVWRQRPDTCAWQPRFWTGPPLDPHTRVVRAQEMHINMFAIFEIKNISVSPPFDIEVWTTAEVEIDGQCLYTNLEQNEQDWCVKVIPVKDE